MQRCFPKHLRGPDSVPFWAWGQHRMSLGRTTIYICAYTYISIYVYAHIYMEALDKRSQVGSISWENGRLPRNLSLAANVRAFPAPWGPGEHAESPADTWVQKFEKDSLQHWRVGGQRRPAPLCIPNSRPGGHAALARGSFGPPSRRTARPSAPPEAEATTEDIERWIDVRFAKLRPPWPQF